MTLATIQPCVTRSAPLRPLPKLRVTCPAYIGGKRNVEGIYLRDRINAMLDNGTFFWTDNDGGFNTIAAVRDCIETAAWYRETKAEDLGLGVVFA